VRFFVVMSSLIIRGESSGAARCVDCTIAAIELLLMTAWLPGLCRRINRAFRYLPHPPNRRRPSVPLFDPPL
jgi:hypothetical protein